MLYKLDTNNFNKYTIRRKRRRLGQKQGLVCIESGKILKRI
jgi:hypothetical protein